MISSLENDSKVQNSQTVQNWSWRDALKSGSDEEEKIVQFREVCYQAHIDISKVCSIGEPEELCLLRYLRANDLKVHLALEQLHESLQWREEKDIWSLIKKTPESILECDPEEIRPYYPHWQRGFDKLGRPILIKKYGGFEIWNIKKLTTIPALCSWHAWEQEQNAALLAQKSAEFGYPVSQYCIIVDVGGMVLKQVNRDFVKMIKAIAAIDQAHHPERMGKTFIVNCPRVFPYVWKGITPFLDKNTVAKIEIYAHPEDYTPAMLKLIDEDQLPSDYGGLGPPLHSGETPVPVEVAEFKKSDEAKMEMVEEGLDEDLSDFDDEHSFHTTKTHDTAAFDDFSSRSMQYHQRHQRASSESVPPPLIEEDKEFLDSIPRSRIDSMERWLGLGTVERKPSTIGVLVIPMVCTCLPTFSQAEKIQDRVFLCMFQRFIKRMVQNRDQKSLMRAHDRANAGFLLMATMAVCLGAFTLHRSQWNYDLVGVFWASFILVCCGILGFVLGFAGTMGSRSENKHLLMLGVIMLELMSTLHLTLSLFCFARSNGDGDSARSSFYVICGCGYLMLFLFSWPPCVICFTMAKKLRLQDNRKERPGKMDVLNFLNQMRSTLRSGALLTVTVAIISIAFAAKGIYETTKYLTHANSVDLQDVNMNYFLILFSFFVFLLASLGLWVSKSYNKLPFFLYWVCSAVLICFLFINAIYNWNQASNVNAALEENYSDGLDNTSSESDISPATLRAVLFTNYVIAGILEFLILFFQSAEVVLSVALYRSITSHGLWILGKKFKLSNTEKALVAWGVLSGLALIFLNGTFAIIHQYIADGGKSWVTAYWEFVGQFDSRYTSGDSFVVSVNGILALVVGPGCLLYAWSVYDHQPYRHIIGSLICILQIYTQVLFFSVEIMTDFSYTSLEKTGIIFGLMILVGIFKLILPIFVAVYSLKKLFEDSKTSLKYKKLITETSWENANHPDNIRKNDLEDGLNISNRLPRVHRRVISQSQSME